MGSVTPWDVTGTVQYDKLIKDFGVKELKQLPSPFSDNILFRRGIIFAHRDFQHIVHAIEQREPFIMMTGLMPTGKFHIGHLLVAQQMIFYQKLGAKIYIAVADIEALGARGQSFEESKRIALEEYIPNYIALGLDIKKTHLYFQSKRSSNATKSCAYYRLQNQFARHATFNEVKAVYGDISPGKLFAAMLQAADMLHPQLPVFSGKMPVIVPVGIDQDPHLRLARDISKRQKYTEFSPLCSTYHYFMQGLSGGKMSASDPNSYLALSESPAVIKKKINKYAFSGGCSTVEEHRKKGGNPDVDVAFQYLRFFFETDDAKLTELANAYRKGTLLTGELKAYTIDKINSFLERHQVKLDRARETVLRLFE
ncbi:MAG: tryptophan--tRNA ligase [Candidatus Woesearchaeota archaeon]|nr:MAG: tryptophan--tRNA ligase [Candidatus Woesearchaeota archaeon]